MYNKLEEQEYASMVQKYRKCPIPGLQRNMSSR